MSAPSFTYATNVAAAGPVVFVKVPTAKLSVAAVDDYGKPIDIYVTEVRLEGPSRLNFTKPPTVPPDWNRSSSHASSRPPSTNPGFTSIILTLHKSLGRTPIGGREKPSTATFLFRMGTVILGALVRIFA